MGVLPSSQLFLQLFALGTGQRVLLLPCEIPPQAPASLPGCKARGFLTNSIYFSKLNLKVHQNFHSSRVL